MAVPEGYLATLIKGKYNNALELLYCYYTKNFPRSQIFISRKLFPNDSPHKFFAYPLIHY